MPTAILASSTKTTISKTRTYELYYHACPRKCGFKTVKTNRSKFPIQMKLHLRKCNKN